MANLPVLQSKEAIIGDLINGFLARVKVVNDTTRGSVIFQFFTAIGQSNFKTAAAIISMLDALDPSRATGEALQRQAADAGVVVSPGTFSTGKVNITDTSFQKVSSTVFSGQPAPVAGSTIVYIVDGSEWNQTGQLYLGRGTRNVEGPLNFTSVTSQGGGQYWQITLDPSNPTTKFHNTGETAVQAKGGNRLIQANTTVSTALGNQTTSVSYATTADAIIQDGEVLVQNVPVTCTSLGTKGNVPRGAISTVVGLPYTASVFNSNPLVDGQDPDDEDAIRQKIAQAELKKSRGTEDAIQLSSLGVTSSDDLKTVQSSDVIRNSDGSATLVFSDGGAYEPIFTGVGIETVLDQAIGGEPEVQLRQYPVVPAITQAIETGPYSIPDQYALEVEIQGAVTTHFFSSSDFKVPSAQQPYEVVSSINGDSNINFSATTADGGTTIYLYPRDTSKNDIKVNARATQDANAFLGFPTNINYALLLYKNDNLLYEDGKIASVTSALKSTWSSSIAPGETLIFQVDSTPVQNITLTLDDFQSVDSNSTVSSSTDITTWTEVLNRLMAGVVVAVEGETLTFTSARGEDSRAAISILGGSLVSKMFSGVADLTDIGRTSDYVLNKNDGQIGLAVDLVPGDKITAGSLFNKAHLNTQQLPSGPQVTGNMWWIVDGATQIISSGLSSSALTTLSKVSSNIIGITTTTPSVNPIGFDLVQPGDWLLLWAETTDQVDFPDLWEAQGFWRIETVKRGYITVNDGSSRNRTFSGLPENIPSNRIVVARSTAPMQKLSFTTDTLSNFATLVSNQLVGITADIVGSTVRISTATADSNGQLIIVAADTPGRTLGLPIATVANNIPSQQGYGVTSDSEAGMPSFTTSLITSEISDTMCLDAAYESHGGTRDDFVQLLDRYDLNPAYAPNDLVTLDDSNRGERIFVRNYDPSTGYITVLPRNFMKDDATPLKAGDRYFLRSSYQFDADDKVTVVVDADALTKAYSLEVGRGVLVNTHSTPTTNDFSADDAESSLAINDTSSFNGFDFSDFKVWRKAATVLTDGTYAMRAQAGSFGPLGNRTRIGFVYPQSNSETTATVTTNVSETIDLGITIPVQTPRNPNWDGTSSFTVDVVNLTPGKDSATYTWRSGTKPNFLGGGGANVQVGDVVMINPASSFLTEDKGVYARVVNVNAQDFTVQVPVNKLVSDSIEFDSMLNVNKVVTVTTPTPHNIQPGDRIGVWGTGLVDLTNRPYDGSYYPTVIDPTTFTFKVGTSVPGKDFTTPGASKASNAITVNASSHGLSVGDVVLISNSDPTNYNGLGTVRTVANPNQFTVLGIGADGAASVSSGRFDFESYVSDYSVEISSSSRGITTTTDTVTVSTGNINHNLITGDVVNISGVDVSEWAGKNSIQVINVSPAFTPQTGAFQLQYRTHLTGSLPFTSTSTNIQNALNSLLTATISNISQSSTTVTIVTTSAHGFVPGDPVIVTGTTNYNGSYVVATGSGSTLTYTTASASPAVETSGTINILHGVIVTGVFNSGSFTATFSGASGHVLQSTLSVPSQNLTGGGTNEVQSISIGPPLVQAWSNATNYVAGQYASRNGSTYVSNSTNTNIDPISVQYWALDIGNFGAPAWSSVTTYSKDQRVTLGGINYISIANSNLNRNPSAILTWSQTSNPILATIYDSAHTYAKGDLVVNSGQYFKSNQSSNLNHPTSNTTYWSRVAFSTGEGNYKLHFTTDTSNIPYNASPGTVQAALQATAIGAGGVSVTAPILNSFMAVFIGPNTNTNVGQITVSSMPVYSLPVSTSSIVQVPTWSQPGDFGYPYRNVVRYDSSGHTKFYLSNYFSNPNHLPYSYIIDNPPSTSDQTWIPYVIPVNTSVYNYANVGDWIEFTSGVESGNKYMIVRKPIIGQESNLPCLVIQAYTSISFGDSFKLIRQMNVVTGTITQGVAGTTMTLSVTVQEPGGNNTVYNVGDVIEFNNTIYIAKLSNTNKQPDINPSFWDITTEDMSGTFIVNVTGANTFTYLLENDAAHSGSETSTGGTVTRLKQGGQLARSLGSINNLQFALAQATTQQIVDDLNQNYSSLIVASVESPTTGSETVSISTEDLDIASGFLNGNVESITTSQGSRLIQMTVDQNVPAGSTIVVSNISGSPSVYNNTYTVLSEQQLSVSAWQITVQSSVFASSNNSYNITGGTFVGSSPYRILQDGENSVLTTNLGSSIGSPTFQVKRTWNLAPKTGEELRLIATTSDQLTRYWNRLVVTGLSNVATIQNSEYGRQIQIETDTFGSSGSIKIAGGNANSKQVALLGSGFNLDDKVGILTIPLDLRSGINEKDWLLLEQTVRGNKITAIDATTQINVVNTSGSYIEITAGNGTFQTQRSISSDITSVFKIEKHGNFVAIINIDGTPIDLADAGVKEGDWVRIKNTIESDYSTLNDYNPGDRVNYSSSNWTCFSVNGISSHNVKPIPDVAWDADTTYNQYDTVNYQGKAYISTSTNNLGSYPNSGVDWALVWEVQEWSGTNTGIFRVVRVFGIDSFWIENSSAIEEIVTLGNVNNLFFYDYDSILPGDTLVISGDILGNNNLGRFTVEDSSYASGYAFPTATRIYVTPIPTASAGSIILGDKYIQVNIEENQPIRMWKRVFTAGPSSATQAAIIVDSPELIDRLSSSEAAFMVSQGKLGYPTDPSFGIDAYKSYNGLIKELNKVIYGDSTDTTNYPGVRAAGTDINIKEAIIRRITLAMSIRVKTGIPFSEVQDACKAAAAGVVNLLGVGEQVSLSQVIEAVNKVNGVVSVVITYPEYDVTKDQIAVSAQEKALIIDPEADINLTILGT